MQSKGLRALFPFSFLLGAGGVFAIWFVGAFFYERLSNFLVEMSLLVSSRRPHFITLPVVGTGMSIRTIMALLGVMFVVGGVVTLLDQITNHGVGADDPPPRPAKETSSAGFDDFGPPFSPMNDPMMGGMPPMNPGMGGGMGGPPMMGGMSGGMPPMG